MSLSEAEGIRPCLVCLRVWCIDKAGTGQAGNVQSNAAVALRTGDSLLQQHPTTSSHPKLHKHTLLLLFFVNIALQDSRGWHTSNMPGTRSTRKRAASPAADAETAAASKPSAAKKAKVADDQKAHTSKTTKTRASGRSKAANAQADDQDEQVDLNAASTEAPKPKAKGKAKSKAAVVDDDDDPGDVKPAAKSTKAASKAKGKAKAKAEDLDDDAEAEVKTEEVQADGGAIDSAADEDAPKVSDAQFAKAKNLKIALDEECHLSSYTVHVDGTNGIIYDAALNQTNAGNNNNKFYKIQVCASCNSWRSTTQG